MAFQRVAKLAEIPENRGLCVEIGTLEIGLFRVGDEVYAMENRCPHAAFPLSEGVLEGCVVVCSAHGWPFDVRTGFNPDHEDGFPIPCYAVELREDAVYLDLDQVTNRGRARKRD